MLQQQSARMSSSVAMPKTAKTLFDKIWEAHLVARRADGRDLIYIDRHVLHELHAPHAFEQLGKQQRPVRRPDLTFSMQDHTVATRPGRDDASNPSGAAFLKAMRDGSRRNGIRLFDIDDPEQGISHVVAPELGMVLPGATHAVPDSHASTVGGLGALAFGCGTSELAHILATQVMALRRPKRMRVRLEGRLAPHVTAKDVALRLIGELGVAGARGHVVEYAGAAVRAMPMESRMTLCNLNIEMGGRSGFVAPDENTFSWIAGRPYAPHGAMWDAALAHWRTLASDEGAAFDREHVLDCSKLEPQVTWGTDPGQVLGISGRVPDPAAAEPSQRPAIESALAYMGLTPGMALAGVKIDRVFIGSCTNSRLPDLEAAAEVVRGRRVAGGVIAMVVPGSTTVKRAAEAKGLDRVFRDAGFSWGESGCSMCAGGNGDRGEPGERCVSTTNRNFEHRQGPKVRTHLVSPATAAASAVAGRIADARQFLAGRA
jgi:3-isopropylmalate/(R)-2-methylmalate dehydratase large subunit